MKNPMKVNSKMTTNEKRDLSRLIDYYRHRLGKTINKDRECRKGKTRIFREIRNFKDKSGGITQNTVGVEKEK